MNYLSYNVIESLCFTGTLTLMIYECSGTIAKLLKLSLFKKEIRNTELYCQFRSIHKRLQDV